MTSPLSTDAGSSEHPVPSPLSGSYEEVPAIFLSHSKKQKPFVERLNEALRRVNHNPFFEEYSLPRGSRSPECIKTAARNCMIGVVVLSEEFVTSKWPMIELEILVEQRSPDAKLLPLFYKLAPKDLKSSEKLAKWRKKWEEMNHYEQEMNEREKESSKCKIVDQWEKALKALRAFNGEIYLQGTSEAEYIKRVVKSICTQAPSSLIYDMSEIVGHQRLAEEVVGQFDRVSRAWQDGGACMVGLHGVGGLGKSTICKAMANFYSSEYPGKSHHLELPIRESATETILESCKQALRVLTDLDDDFLKRADNIDQVIQLMKVHLTTRHDVFLAIDNVWESSREVARRILKVGFSVKSKILVTSRSEELLKELLRNQKNSLVSRLPAPDRKEASQIFQEAFELGDLNSLVRGRQLVNCVLESCIFNGTYHALALKALGIYVKNACPLGGWQHVKDDVVSSILERIRNADLKKVDDVIKLTYDNLPEHKQCAFLDIALLPTMRDDYGPLTYEKSRRWLSSLYDNQSPEAMIRELSLGGLLQLQTDGHTGETTIRVHDLLFDLAEREVASGSRFFIAGISSCAVEEIQWQDLERLALRYRGDEVCIPQVIEKLQGQECRRLQVLDVRGGGFSEATDGLDVAEVGFSEGIDMRLLPALRVLKLRGVSLRSIQNCPASALAIIDLDDVCFEPPLPRMPIIKHFGVMSLKDVGQLLVPHMEGIEGLGTLKTLQSLQLAACKSLKRIPDLRGLSRLDRLRLWGNEAMEEVGGLSSTLRHVDIGRCTALKRGPAMSGLTRLVTLRISACGALDRIPDLSSVTRLDKLVLFGKVQMEEGGCLSSTLRHVEICGMEEVPDISGLTRLETLKIESCSTLKDVGSLSSTLKSVIIWWCRALERLPDMSGLTRLETLSLHVCQALKRIPDLSGLARLDKLVLLRNRSMEEVGGLNCTLRHLEIGWCDTLKRVPDISGLTRLQTLVLRSNKALEEVEGQSVSSTLTNLDIRGCSRLTSFPQRV